MLSQTNLQWSGDRFPNFEAARLARQQKQHAVTAAQCGAEKLEARLMFTTVSFNNVTGVLTVVGNSTSDTITVYEQTGGQIKLDINASPWGPYSGVTRVDVDALAGMDTVEVESNDYFVVFGDEEVSVSTRLTGGADDDLIVGGAQADTLYGGYGGGDYIYGYLGNDLMYGGDGGAGGNIEVAGDAMYGGQGNDTIYGEDGNDGIFGGDGNGNPNTGNDLLYGGAGNDILIPDDGTDSAYGGSGNDTFRGSHDMVTDWLDGEGGTDDAGSAGTDYDSPGDSLFNFP